MDPDKSSPQDPKETEKSVSKNPLTNLQTIIKGRLPSIKIGKPGEDFWKTITVVSIVLNLALLFVMITLGNSIFRLKTAIDDTGFEEVAKAMTFEEGATLSTSIRVQDQVPMTFEVPLQRNTVVTLSEPARIDGASISIRSATFSIDAPASLTLPVGAELPLALDFSVTVDAVVPIDLTVPVEFPIADSEIGESLSAMQGLLDPYRSIVAELPGCWQMLLWGGDCP
jgi:hypothetical protein